MGDLHKINTAIDNYTLDYLSLLEKNIEENVELEKSIKQGYFHLAKARYIMGHRNVSSLQIPNEDSPEVEPVVTVHDTDGERELNITDLAHETEVTDPMKWFGVLVPQDLRYAQSQFQRACKVAVGRANLKDQINDLAAKLMLLLSAKKEVIGKQVEE